MYEYFRENQMMYMPDRFFEVPSIPRDQFGKVLRRRARRASQDVGEQSGPGDAVMELPSERRRSELNRMALCDLVSRMIS